MVTREAADDDPQDPLRRMLSEFAELRARQPERERHFARARSACEPLAQVVLVHGTDGRACANILANSRISSRSALGTRKVLPTQVTLGTQDCIYWCAGVLYPAREVALIFDAHLEERGERFEASPWDSGWMARSRESSGDGREIFERCLLRAPDHRRWIVEHVANCYPTMGAFIRCEAPTFKDFEGLMCDRWESWVVEVRARAEHVGFDSRCLRAVLVQGDSTRWLTHPLLEQLELWSRRGVEVSYTEPDERIQDRARTWVLATLGLAEGRP